MTLEEKGVKYDNRSICVWCSLFCTGLYNCKSNRIRSKEEYDSNTMR